MNSKASIKYAAESPSRSSIELGVPHRPRERALSYGVGHLSDLELVQAVLGSGTASQPVHRISADVLEALESQPSKPSLPRLLEINGMGVARSVMICAAMELARRLYFPSRIRIRSPADALPLVRHYADRNQEYFLCLSLNGAHEVIACRVVTIGLLNRTLVHPREIFADPLADRAAAIIIAHNHPSGSLEPSTEDREVTYRMVQAGDLLGIPVLDHLVFSERGHTSLRDLGLM